MQRTKALGLLHKQIKKDSSRCRQGIPDHLCVFMKHGENIFPVVHSAHEFPVEKWQRWASPVWFDIQQGNTLNKLVAKEEKDEKHICPLQLEVIERAIELWTNPGDLVFSPFAGIGSEGYEAIRLGRRFLGIELKEKYAEIATKNLQRAETLTGMKTLFDLEDN
jgi:DNA modification methylase